MLNEQQFREYCRQMNFSDKAQSLIRHIRSSEPSRPVRGGSRGVTGKFPSRKMMRSIQFQSHKLELPIIYELEHDPAVLEFYEQPPAIKLTTTKTNGKPFGFYHTPDFFVLKTDCAAWMEAVGEDALLLKALKTPERYRRNADGEWQCSPGDTFAAEFGFQYIVATDARVNWNFQQNLDFLNDFYRAERLVSQPAKTAILEAVKRNCGLSLAELINEKSDLYACDDIYALIVREELYVDLQTELLTEPDRAKIFSSAAAAETHRNIWRAASELGGEQPAALGISIRIGAEVEWEARRWRISHIGSETIYLTNKTEGTDIPSTLFNELIRRGTITQPAPPPLASSDSASSALPSVNFTAAAGEIFARASESDLRTANSRFDLVSKYLRGEINIRDLTAASARSLYRWVSSYKAARQTHGNGYVGLIPKPNPGNRQTKLPAETLQVLRDFIDSEYSNNIQKSRINVYNAYKIDCEERGIHPATYKTFCRHINNADQYELTRRREGTRAAYPLEKFFFELEQTTPRHGTHPFQIAHIDHTLLDIELDSWLGDKKLGRPVLSLLLDAHTRRVLSFFLSFDPPSYRTNMVLLRECVRRWGRLPQNLVMDGGNEFSSVYFESLLAIFEITKKQRPPAKGRFGSVLERLFGITNTQLIHNLQGNTKITKKVRLVTNSVNPKKLAVWTLPELYQLLEHYYFEIYDTALHSALDESPRAAFARNQSTTGFREHRMIPYNNNFKLLTLPNPIRKTVKIDSTKGVQINYIAYWSELFRNPVLAGQGVEVRYDPYDLSRAYAYVNKNWTECFSEYRHVFKNRTEREIQLSSEELRRQKKLNKKNTDITGKQLAEFFESVNVAEKILRQRTADREQQVVFRIMDGEILPTVWAAGGKQDAEISDARNAAREVLLSPDGRQPASLNASSEIANCDPSNAREDDVPAGDTDYCSTEDGRDGAFEIYDSF